LASDQAQWDSPSETLMCRSVQGRFIVHRPGGWLGIGGASLEVDGDHKAAGSLTSATGPQGRLCLASDR